LRSSVSKGGFFFTPGDTLLYAGYAGGLESGMLDTPQENTSHTFQFATNMPCPGTPTVEYEGHVYETIQVFSQCWLKQNLEVGTMIPGSQSMSDNGIIEKYCYNDEPDSCNKYGGLYQWDEMMQYTAQQGGQGICPPGWHVPSDEEWKILEGAVDSQYGIGDPVWDLFSSIDRGFDDGTNLKTTSGWKLNGNGTDLFGYQCLPSGYLDNNGIFGGIDYFGEAWTSTQYDEDDAWYRSLYWDPIVDRDVDYKIMGLAVRCIKD
jgi:uncharacterized protein (TIGR02145 family)